MAMAAFTEQPAEKQTSEIALGDIVVLTSHPFFKHSHAKTVHIGGYAAHVPPMMVVIEMVLEKTDFTDPERGAYREHQNYQCLCVWYSAKRCAFEQNWFPFRVLRKVEGCDKIERLSAKENKWKIGDTVTLITSSCEADKVQVSKKWKDSRVAEHGDFRAALAYVCPPLTIVGSCANKATEPLIDNKTGQTKRWRAGRFVKVKYYNEKEDKFSEHLLPESCLANLEPVSQALIEKLLGLIEAGSFVWIKDSEGKDLVSIGVAKGLNYVSGQYFLLVKCYLYNKMETINVSGIKRIDSLERSWETNSEGGRRGYRSVLPDFIPRDNRVSITHSDDADAIRILFDNFSDSPWRITYRSFDKTTGQRTILPLKILQSDGKSSLEETSESTTEENSKKAVDMIYAQCFNSQMAELYFSTARIIQLQVLPITVSKKGDKLIISHNEPDWQPVWEKKS